MKNKPTNTRTRSGCLTCRDRHMKCDEGLPICNNCKKLNRKCVRGLRLNFIQYLTYDPQEIGKQRLENIHIYNHRIIDQLITIASLYKNGLHNYKPFLKYHTKEQLQEANVHFHELFKKFENKTNSITNTTFYKNSMDVSDIMKSSTSTQFENSDSTNRWYKRNPIDTNSHVLSYQSIKNQQRRPTVEDYNRQMVYGTQALYRDTGSYPVQNQPGTLSKSNVYEKENPAHYSSSITRLSYNPQAASNWRQESDPTAALGSNTPLFSNHPRSSSDQFYSSVSHNSSRSQNLSLENASFNMNNDFIGFNTNSFLLRQLSSDSHDQSTLTERSISNVNQGINWFADLFNDLQIWESIIPVYLNQVGIQNVLMKLGMTRLLESFSYYNSLIPNVDFKTTMLKAHHSVKLQMRDINKVQEIIDLQDRLVNQFGPSSHTEVLFSVVTLLMELLIIICQLELCNGQLRKVSLDGNSNSDTYDVNAIFLQQIQVFNSIHNQLHTPQNQLTQAILTSLIHLVIILKFVLSIKISGKVLPLNNLELNLLKNPSNYDYRVYTRDVLYRDMSINKDQHNILGTEQFKHSSISDNASNKTLGGHYTDSFLLCNQFWSVIRSFYTQSEEYQYRFDEEMQFDVTQMAPNLVAPQNFDPFKHVMSDRVLAILILLQEETKTTKSHMNDISNNYIRSMLYSGQLHYINEQEMKNVWHIYFNWTVE